jgi:hypothetical protein
MDLSVDRASPEQALAIYAESLVPRGVVAVIGDSAAGVGELVLRLGARSVHVWDPDEARANAQAALAPRGMTVRPLAREDLVRRDFDLALVPDLGLFDDPAGLLADVRKMLGEQGVTLVGARNAEAAQGAKSFDYYELFDAVAAEFDFVRMVARLPFRGVALVELGDEADTSAGVSVDTQLGEEGGTPDAYVALGSQRDVRLDPYSIVQLPSNEVDEVDEAFDVAVTLLPPPPPPQPPPPPLRDEHGPALAALRAELVARTEDVAALERALADRNRQVSALTGEVAELRTAVDAGRQAAADELDELIARVDKAEHRVAEQAREHAALEHDGGAAEHEAIEARLRERARVIRELEAELVRRDRLIRDLASALEEATGEPAAAAGPVGQVGPVGPAGQGEEEVASLRRRLDAMALDLARREGEAQAAAWANQELERRLEVVTRGAPDGRLAAALDELEALRAALVQEHDARLQAEARFSAEER